MTAQLLSTRHIYLLLSMSYEYFTTIPQQYGGTPHYSSSGSPLQTGDPLEPTSHKTFIFYKSVQPTSIHESKDNVQEFSVLLLNPRLVFPICQTDLQFLSYHRMQQNNQPIRKPDFKLGFRIGQPFRRTHLYSNVIVHTVFPHIIAAATILL